MEIEVYRFHGHRVTGNSPHQCVSLLATLSTEDGEALRRISGSKGLFAKKAHRGDTEALQREMEAEELVKFPPSTVLQTALSTVQGLQGALGLQVVDRQLAARIAAANAKDAYQVITGSEEGAKAFKKYLIRGVPPPP